MGAYNYNNTRPSNHFSLQKRKRAASTSSRKQQPKGKQGRKQRKVVDESEQDTDHSQDNQQDNEDALSVLADAVTDVSNAAPCL